jgi:hypothetical protein
LRTLLTARHPVAVAHQPRHQNPLLLHGWPTILVKYPDDAIVLVDCGCKKTTPGGVRRVVKPEIEKLLQTSVYGTGNRLNALVLTHPHDDHYNLVKDLIIDKKTVVDNLFYGGQIKNYSKIDAWMRKQNRPYEKKILQGDFCQPNSPIQQLSYGGVEVRILAANVGSISSKDFNDMSITLLLRYPNVNIFLMGDATQRTEEFILGWNKANSRLTDLLKDHHTMLKAGHHGSLTSSSPKWLDTIRPEVVFVSSDSQEFSGTSLPRSSVMNRFRNGGHLVPVFPPGLPPHDQSAGLHYYVQYNDETERHEPIKTDLALFTTLHFLAFSSHSEFEGHGTSWHYVTDSAGVVHITPSCGWGNINKSPSQS